MDQMPIIVLTGPTAVGKTALGVQLARLWNGEVISADSMQLYRGMDIGTAKPDETERQGIPHHMIDVAEPGEAWSVSRWTEGAVRCAEDILARNKCPLLVGGTGLYIESFLAGGSFGDAPFDPAVRESLSAEYDTLGGEVFREKLRAVDPSRAEKLAPADKKRLVRAMEVYTLTGETITAHDERSRKEPPRFPSLRYALTFRDRSVLYARIEERVDDMVRRGLFDEVASLLAAGLSRESTAMQAIGYKEVAASLRGECTPSEAIEAVKRESCRYAKRQLTWLRRDGGLVWLPREEYPDTEALTDRISQDLRRLST